jgi:hypothetical protein
MRNAVLVTSTDINSHIQKSEPMYLKRHWAHNARRPLSYTMEFKLMSAISQGIGSRS